MDKDQLAALDRAATQGVWHLQSGAIGVNPWISAGNWTREDGSYVRGGCILNMVAHDEREQDAALIVALVNAYRTGNLVLIDDGAVEALRALVEYHRTGGHEGNGSDENLARCTAALSTLAAIEKART
jgi:hypothetical protein